MANIIINTENPFYQKVTANRGVRGLGFPYRVLQSNPNKIVLPENLLRTKLSDLESLKTKFENASGATLNDWDRKYGTSRDEDSVIYYLQDSLRDILFKGTTVPSEASGKKGGNWFDAYNSSFSYNVFRENDRFGSRRIGVEVLTDWVKLLNDILNFSPNLAEKETFQTVTGIDEESRADNVSYGKITVNVTPYTIPITDAILSSFNALVQLKTLQFFDETKEYKTVLNFGGDQQYLIEAWRQSPTKPTSIQLKLLKPLDNAVANYAQAYIVKEFANPIVDTINVETPAVVDTTLSLRPANMDVGKFGVNKQSIKNVTLTSLGLITGSVGVISGSTVSYDDRVFNRWYTADFNSSELNIDFSDYNNFVFFGSAKARLDAFTNKLNKIQSYTNTVSLSGSTVAERKTALEVEYIKRNFDPYEQFLYYASQSIVYSASAYYVDGGVEYNATGSWPKNNGVPIQYTQIQDWYTTQSAIAERFDEFNPNYLVKHLPEHIQEDENSADFITFIEMFGHVMDNLKVYIDQMPNIYSTNPDPFSELTMDQVYEVAQSFGLDLPNAFSVESLQSFVASLYDGTGARSFLAETWKRFLHSSTYLRKLKGSRTGADAVINTFGLNSPLVQVKESTYAVEGNYIKSDELVYALQFTGSVSSSIYVPFVSSSYSASTLQVRFIPSARKQSSLLTTNGTWGIEVVPHPSAALASYFTTQSVRQGNSYYTLTPDTVNYGKINVISGSGKVVIASSSYFPLFSETYTHIMLRSQSQDITIMQTDGDQLLFQQSSSLNFGSLWNSTYVYLGGTGSIKVGNFDGIIDDVRVWGENISKDNFIKQVYDPGAYYGANYSSSYNSLYVDLSFSQEYSAITQSATNESPFSGVSNILNIPAYGFTTASYVRILRSIKQYTPIVGSSIFSNKKVTVAPAPVFLSGFVDENGTKTLRTNDSIKPIQDKIYVGGQDYVQFAVSPTDFVNQTILRSMGDIDTNYLIGSPRKYNNERYPELDKILDFFLKNYNESINVNEYIRFFRNVLKAPSEYMESYVPARSKLTNGVVIESSILDRRKTYIQKAIRVDGSNTQTFENFVSGSGSANVGAYDFLAEYVPDAPLDTTVITKPVLQKIDNYTVTSSLMSDNGGIGIVDATVNLTLVGPVSSTPSASVPQHRRFLQNVSTNNNPSSSVQSSLADDGSGIGFVDARIAAEARTYLTQSGYPRKPYEGLQYLNSTTYRISSEINTLNPFYEIQPISDFSDVGTTTYFHRSFGVYPFSKFNGSIKESKFNKIYYLAKLDVPIGEIESAAVKELNRIALLPTSSLTDYPGRSEVTISTKTYTSTVYKGVLNIANIFSLYRVNGPSGLRLRLYATQENQENDVSRDFYTLPVSSAGVLFDGLLTGNVEAFPYTLIQTEGSTIYFTVDNLTASDITSTIKLTYFEYEPANLAPTGYLSRHYRFTRTNNIATLRRNYLGCRTVYCPEGCPPDVTNSVVDSPIIVEFAPRTSATTTNRNAGSPRQALPGNDVVKFGGKGPLK